MQNAVGRPPGNRRVRSKGQHARKKSRSGCARHAAPNRVVEAWLHFHPFLVLLLPTLMVNVLVALFFPPLLQPVYTLSDVHTSQGIFEIVFLFLLHASF